MLIGWNSLPFFLIDLILFSHKKKERFTKKEITTAEKKNLLKRTITQDLRITILQRSKEPTKQK